MMHKAKSKHLLITSTKMLQSEQLNTKESDHLDTARMTSTSASRPSFFSHPEPDGVVSADEGMHGIPSSGMRSMFS